MKQHDVQTCESLISGLSPAAKMQFKYFYQQYAKNLLIAYLFLLIGGVFGIHKFYLNKRSAWLYLLFCWSLIPVLFTVIDLFLLPWQVAKINQKLRLDLLLYLHNIKQDVHDLSALDKYLQQKRLVSGSWLLIIILIIGLILPGLGYAYLFLTHHNLELHYKFKQPDGGQTDQFWVI